MLQCTTFLSGNQTLWSPITWSVWTHLSIKSWTNIAHTVQYTSSALYVIVLWKQPSFKQTSETVGAKRWIKHIITQWVPGSWAGNSKCPTPIRAETVSRHSEEITPSRTKTSSTGHIGDWNAVLVEDLSLDVSGWHVTYQAANTNAFHSDASISDSFTHHLLLNKPQHTTTDELTINAMTG